MIQNAPRALAWTLLIGLLVVLACWPVTTRYGVNYEWSSRRITLFEKAVSFVSRDLQTRRLVREIVAGAANPSEKVTRIFTWIGADVQPTPPGFPVIDDHLFHVIVRGYGASDQRTEVFALLASYAGLAAGPAALRVEAEGRTWSLPVALVRTGDGTTLVDVKNHLLFRTLEGRLAFLDDLRRDPGIVMRVAGGLTVDGLPYVRYFSRLSELDPALLRMELQKPWPRLKYEVSRLFAYRP